jgi:asparagine synthetase B (glutamine-hydrolysing)
VAAALVGAVTPLGDAAAPVELSLTGGKDSRLIAAALTAASVPFRARTHGFASHPDVIVAAMIAERLGLEHTVTEPRPAATALAPDQAEVLSRLRSAVLMSDGMLSAFENVGRPDPVTAGGSAGPVQTGGHGGELLRGGYAQAAWRSGPAARPANGARAASSARVSSSAGVLSSAAATELFRRMTTRRLRLLRPAAAAAYLASLTPSAAALAGGPLRALDDFYLVNRAGRWSAAARQAYLIRAPLVQPFFADRVVRAARAVPLRQRIGDQLHRDVLAELCPELLGIPLAGKPWQGQPRTADSVVTAAPASPAAPDWRRTYGPEIAGFLRGYILDAGRTGPMFEMMRRPSVERLLQRPHADPQATWTLATLAALLSGDWLNAREQVPRGDVPAGRP